MVFLVDDFEGTWVLGIDFFLYCVWNQVLSGIQYVQSYFNLEAVKVWMPIEWVCTKSDVYLS